MKFLKNSAAIMLIVILGFLWLTKDASAVNYEKQVKKLIKAIQQQDFETIFDLTEYCHSQISIIKSQNPKVLWEKKISEFYESGKAQFLKRRDIKTVLQFYTYDMTPISAYKMLIYFLTPQSEWKILEQRGNIIFVSVKYPDIENSPSLYSKRLKETMFKFEMSQDGLFRRCHYMEDGEVSWESKELKHKTISPETLSLSTIELTAVETKWVKKYHQPYPPKLIIVPAIQFRIKNITQAHLKNISLNAIFKFKGTSQNLGEMFYGGVNLLPGETSKVFLLKSNYGVEGKTKESILNNPKWKIVELELFIQYKGSSISLGIYEVTRKIEDF